MHRSATWLFAVAVAATAAGSAFAQEKDDIRELKLRDWEPRSMLMTKVTEVARPAFPVIDVHNHLGGGKAFSRPSGSKRYLDGDGRGRRAHGGQPRRRLGREAQGDARRARRGPSRPVPHLRPHRLRRHRRAGLVGPRGRAAGRELRGRGQGAEVPQVAGPGRPLQGRPVPAGRRPQARPDLGSLRQLQAAGRDPHGRPRRLLHAARPVQRALARAERASRVALPRQGLSPAAPSCTPSGSGSSPGTRTRRSSAPIWPTTAKTSPRSAAGSTPIRTCTSTSTPASPNWAGSPTRPAGSS